MDLIVKEDAKLIVQMGVMIVVVEHVQPDVMRLARKGVQKHVEVLAKERVLDLVRIHAQGAVDLTVQEVHQDKNTYYYFDYERE